MADSFERAFIVHRVIDGDTLIADDVDLGYHVHVSGIEYRILHVDTPERRKPTLAAGNVAKAYTEDWCTLHARHGGLFAQTVKTDSFGRYLATIRCGEDHDLGSALLSSGNAVSYEG